MLSGYLNFQEPFGYILLGNYRTANSPMRSRAHKLAVQCGADFSRPISSRNGQSVDNLNTGASANRSKVS